MKPKQKLFQLICSGYLLAVLFLGYVPMAQAQILQGPLNTNQPQQTTLPQYNRGVDTSIKDFLCAPDESNLGTALYDCIGKIYRFGIAFGAIAVVFFVVWAGYMYMVGGEAAKGKAKGMILNSLFGIGLILASYLILSFINPDLVKIKPIQPPIFTAVLPTCEEVGFTTDCIITTGENANQVFHPSTGSGKRCSPPISGPATTSGLGSSCFNQYGSEVVRQAAVVANAESNGNPALPVGAGSCGRGKRPARCSGGEIPVWGLYQINITAHKVDGLDCPSAFAGGAWTCSTGCTVTNPGLYNQCVAAAKDALKNTAVACKLYAGAKSRGKPGFCDWGNVRNEHGIRCNFPNGENRSVSSCY